MADRFTGVKNYDELIEANLLFLNGKTFLTPYTEGPLHFETEAILPGLKILHSRGVLTIDSQPPLDEENELRQKSYLEGYFEDIDRLVKIFDRISAKDPTFRYQIFTKSNHKLTTNCREVGTSLTEDYVDDHWEYFSRSWSFLEAEDVIFERYPNIESFIKYCGHFLIFCDKFGGNSVVDLLLEELI